MRKQISPFLFYLFSLYCLKNWNNELKFRSHAHDFYDFDGSKFKIINETANPDTTKLGFTWYGVKEILNNGGKELLEERYGDYLKEHTLEGYPVVLSLGPDQKPEVKHISKDLPEEEKAVLKEENIQAKLKLIELAEQVSHKWAGLKAEFMGAPIRKALLDLKEENKETYMIEIPYRATEKYWVKKTENNVIVYFSINFKDATDIALAKIMCNELKDAKKISSQAVTVMYYQKLDQSSDIIGELKITQKDCSCGVISFALSSVHLKKNLETAVYFLATFRQYIEFHIKMAKCLLHNRMRKRIGKFEIVFEKALREGVKSKAEYKATIGGKKQTDKADEEKVNVLSKKKNYDESEYTIG